MSKSVSVPAELVERLRRMVENPMWHSHALWHAAARALIDAVERPSEDDDPNASYLRSVLSRPYDAPTPAPPSLPDRDEAPSISDEAEAKSDPSAVPETTDRSDDEIARLYDPAVNGYDLAADPRCLYGWGPPEHGCDCRWGHACFRAYGHPGKCWDAGGPLEPVEDRLKCAAVQRPKDWDSRGRLEANR